MKTTIEVSDALFHSAKEFVRGNDTTMRALVEEGLRRVLADTQSRSTPSFKLKDARVHGKKMLIPDPRDWQQMEEGHVASRVVKPLA